MFLKGNEYPVIPISVINKTNYDMFYSELETKLNTYQGKSIKQLRVDPKDYNNLYQWIKK
jgi:hypothetical protein